MMTDPIADMLARIRNAAQARHERAEMPGSSLKLAVAQLLKAEGYVQDVTSEKTDDGRSKITVFLKYGGRERKSAIVGMRKRSRPGRRIYVGCDEIPKVQNGIGVAILSTSSGVVTDRVARERRVGGELLCEVW
jgi:small subunit ribosomal protein S8